MSRQSSYASSQGASTRTRIAEDDFAIFNEAIGMAVDESLEYRKQYHTFDQVETQNACLHMEALFKIYRTASTQRDRPDSVDAARRSPSLSDSSSRSQDLERGPSSLSSTSSSSATLVFDRRQSVSSDNSQTGSSPAPRSHLSLSDLQLLPVTPPATGEDTGSSKLKEAESCTERRRKFQACHCEAQENYDYFRAMVSFGYTFEPTLLRLDPKKRQDLITYIRAVFWAESFKPWSHLRAKSTELMQTFGRRTDPTAFSFIPIDEELRDKCAEAAALRRGEVEGALLIPLFLEDHQRAHLNDSIIVNTHTGDAFLRRHELPRMFLDIITEEVPFGIVDTAGVPVQATAINLATVHFGFAVLSDIAQPRTVRIQLAWPGYTTAYVEIVLPAQCNRQLLAQLVSREFLVWATILQFVTPAEGYESWRFGKDGVSFDQLWLVAVRKVKTPLGEVWTVDMQVGR